MATELERFRDHCRAMADGREHRADCPSLRGRLPWERKPSDDGCVPAPDRALFARLADEIDAYLSGDLCTDCGQPLNPEPDPALWELA